jgi:protein tyrosine/serine phosphatase
MLKYLSSKVPNIWFLFFDNNFEILDENFARSAQPSIYQLKRIKDRFKPKTILNLRGRNSGKKWYREEKEFCEKQDIKLIDLKLHCKKKPTKKQIIDILYFLKDSEKPLYIHCKGGSQRTGLVSTIYEHVINQKPIHIAMRQVSFNFGNILPYQRRFFIEYIKESGGKNFENWVINTDRLSLT